MKKILTILLLIASNAIGATYYVKPTGNDANSGLSEALAWEHVQKGLETATAGDTVFIRSGTYSENSTLPNWNGGVNVGFVPHNNGTAGNEIVFKGYPGDVRPVILGVNASGGCGTGCGRMAAGLYGNIHYIVFDSLKFHYGWFGIYMDGIVSNLTVRNCILDSMYSGGYDNGGCFTTYANQSGGSLVSDVLIENCDISWVGEDGEGWGIAERAGITFYNARNFTIRNNTFHHLGHGINLKQGGPSTYTTDSSKNFYIYGNTFHDIVEGIRLGGAGPFYHVYIYNNVMYNFSFLGGGDRYGIGSLASNASYPSNVLDAYIYNNTFDLGGTASGLRFQRGMVDSLSVFNNIFYNAELVTGNYGNAVAFKNDGNYPTLPARSYMDYNLFAGRADTRWYHWLSTAYTKANFQALALSNLESGYAVHDVASDPQFTDIANHNYTPQPGSPALTGGRGGSWPSYFGAIGTGAPAITGYLSIGDVTVTEGGSAVFSVTLTAAQAANLSLSYATSAGTATVGTSCTAGIDYVSATGTRTITTGQTSTTITVPTCDDATVEAQEQFYVVISSPSISTVVISDNTGQCNLNDNDLAPSPGNKRIEVKGNVRLAGKVRVGSKP